MPRNLLKVFVLGIAVLVVGCDGSESTRYPEDGRSQSNPIDNNEPGTLSGRALVGGYLDGATVWLDVNENGRLDEGEPVGESSGGGHFQLDTSSLQEDVSVGPDRDARDYPLMLLAKKGRTTEEVNGSPLAVDQNYLLLAPPGVTIITPYTTLVEFERRLPGYGLSGGTREQVALATERAKQRLGAGPTGFSLHIDYLRGDSREAVAYAQAIAALIARQTNLPLENASAESMLAGDGLNVLAGAVLGQVNGVVGQATELMKAGVEHFDAADLDLPVFELPAEDPVVLYEQRLYMNAGFDLASQPENMIGSKGAIAGGASAYNEENQSAELRFFYDGLGRLVEIEVDGWTEPDLANLYALVSADGYMARLDTQYGPGLLLRYSSVPSVSESTTPRERYVFNWASAGGEPVIAWHTNNTETVPGAGNTLDDDPEAEFSLDGPTLELKRKAATEPETLTVTVPEVPEAECKVVPALDETDEYRLLKTYSFTDGGQSTTQNFFEQCSVGDEAEAPEFICERVVDSDSSLSPFSDTYNNPTDAAPRLLRNSTRGITFAGAESLVESVNAYLSGSADDPLTPEKTSLLNERVIHLVPPDVQSQACSLQSRAPDNHVLAVATYEYMQLSTRLAEQTRRE